MPIPPNRSLPQLCLRLDDCTESSRVVPHTCPQLATVHPDLPPHEPPGSRFTRFPNVSLVSLDRLPRSFLVLNLGGGLSKRTPSISLVDIDLAVDKFSATMTSMNNMNILARAPYQSVNEWQGPATQPSVWNPVCDPPYQFSRMMDPVLPFDGAGQRYFSHTASIPATYTNAGEFIVPYASIPPMYTDTRDFLQAAHSTPPSSEHIYPSTPTTEDLVDASFSPSMAMAMAPYTNEWPDHGEMSPQFAADSEQHVPDMIAAYSPSNTPSPPGNSGPHVSSGDKVEAEYGDDAYGGNSPLFSPAPSNAFELHNMEPSPESPPHASPTTPANDWAAPSEVQTQRNTRIPSLATRNDQ
ncbi:hypothetical protein C8R44DRAFT_980831 [Mycena epipterygia]|nr:hypothetical protein C8R44DRAFT_980831 [Mycena epipterygia]